MERGLNADLDYYQAVMESKGSTAAPYVLILYDEGIPKTILVGRIEDAVMKLKIGYKILVRRRVRALNVVWDGVLGEDSYKNCELLVRELTEILSRKEIDMVGINHIRIDSPLFRAAKSVPGILCRDYFPTVDTEWKLRLPSSYEEYLQSMASKTRANLRNYSNRITKRFGGTMSIRCYAAEADLDSLMHDVEKVASKSYQRGLGVGFINNEETRKRFVVGLKRNWLKSYLLYIKGEPAAFWNAWHYGETLSMESTGFLSEYREYHLGIYLLMKVIEESIRAQLVKYLSFGPGDGEYKRIYCNEGQQEASIHVFAPKCRGIVLNAERTVITSADRLGRMCLHHLGIYKVIKKKWRQFLSKQANQ
jgi:hypothetical protein